MFKFAYSKLAETKFTIKIIFRSRKTKKLTKNTKKNLFLIGIVKPKSLSKIIYLINCNIFLALIKDFLQNFKIS